MAEDFRIGIRRMMPKDIPQLVELHSEVFPGYNATMMGDRYLESLYRILANHSACVSVVACEDAKILGWIGGVGDWLSFEKTLVRENIVNAPAILYSVLKNRPILLMKMFNSVSRVLKASIRLPARRDVNHPKATACRPASLLVIGVVPKHQNQSIGQLMMDEFHRRLSSNSFTTCTLSASSDNRGAVRAFTKAGYEPSWAHDGIIHYIRDLSGYRP